MELRGAGLKLQSTLTNEVIISGPSETGKTVAATYRLHRFASLYPGSQWGIVRKTYKSIIGSAYKTFKKFFMADNPTIHPFGKERPEWLDYPNGSRIWLYGMDTPDKLLSSELDGFYVNQAEELSADDWEILTTRATGRAANVYEYEGYLYAASQAPEGAAPWSQVFGDCNPGPERHWILDRSKGPLVLLFSKHEDNPTLFHKDGTISSRGKKTLAILDRLTGARKERLRYGRWVNAEGVVYEDYDKALHLIDLSYLVERGLCS